LGSLKKRLNQVTLEAAEIELNLKHTTQILTQSEVLITELGDEFKRWKQQLNEIYEMITVLSRKCLTVAAYAHLANLEQSNEKRKKIFENLINLLELNTFDLTEFLELDSEEDVFITVFEGNTAVIPCSPPHSVPYAITEFVFNVTKIYKSDGKISYCSYCFIFIAKLIHFLLLFQIVM